MIFFVLLLPFLREKNAKRGSANVQYEIKESKTKKKESCFVFQKEEGRRGNDNNVTHNASQPSFLEANREKRK